MPQYSKDNHNVFIHQPYIFINLQEKNHNNCILYTLFYTLAFVRLIEYFHFDTPLSFPLTCIKISNECLD